ncbi:uncharacterized protein K444DRAFT_242197 [Hyaloscypha bicolor E]|uniref:Uncharacterized protein n=1 Tax=Hyaloscypha bicolor E TaxID=1095630 RepID=A0A2J6SM17_9HELO|nr:uncharacterized protein K444DRAFT_242197 [Hyaloscypha bicolor E]PMD51811.1 hypothetical protein K444DRAFT_242197 [Hyaloscypha bicolor E]
MCVGEHSGPFDLAYSNSIFVALSSVFQGCYIAAFCRALRTSRIRVSRSHGFGQSFCNVLEGLSAFGVARLAVSRHMAFSECLGLWHIV